MRHKTPTFDNEAIYFIPLGGTNEIGMNCNLYGYQDQWIMVDCGVAFGGNLAPGITATTINPQFVDNKKIAGLVITHAHEDHIGAVPWLWQRLRCPVYVTPFAAVVLRKKLAETPWGNEVPIKVVQLCSRFACGPFEVEFATITHSIPEPNAVIIHTKQGPILHTGDWKFDPAPQIGTETDYDRLKALGEEDCLAVIGDSTNAMEKGHSGSEGEVSEALASRIRQAQGRVAVTSFASNVARIRTITKVAHQEGRQVQLVGRSMHFMVEAATQCGYMSDLPAFVTPKQARKLPRNQLLLICTGSQGEPAAALQKLATNAHRDARIEDGDTVIFSSRRIPGNEVGISILQNKLLRAGINVIEADEEDTLHVSGHPNRDELTELFRYVRPTTAIPVHGEARHLKAHAELARTCQVPIVLEVYNGAVVRLTSDSAEVTAQIPDEYYLIDNQSYLAERNADYLLDRQRLGHSGVVLAIIAMDAEGDIIGDLQLSCIGLPADAFDQEPLIEELYDAIDDLDATQVQDNALVEQAVTTTMRRSLRRLSWSPLYRCTVLRLEEEEVAA
ncbi:MAG: ribonuclease J [Alphaproteobacteria bacterium]|nr:ribonuclease J [Alphaproteobacteria bacterium]